MIRYHASHVLPISAPPIARGTVAVEGAQIRYVGGAANAPPGADVDLGDSLLMPGLVNAHCHLELTAMRGFLEDLDFRSWILRLTTARRAVLSRDDLLDAARVGLREGIRAGITTYADSCESGVALDAMRQEGVRGVMYQEVFGPDPATCAASMADLRERIDALRPLETPLARLGVSPHAPYTVSDDLFRAAARYAADEGLPLAVHIAESELETRLVTAADGAFADALRQRAIEVRRRASSPIQLLHTLGVLSQRTLLIHCVRADAQDIATVAEARCGVAHCPASNAKLGHGIAPLTEMLAAGIDVGLGSDSMASNNRMDILEEARLALLWQRARAQTPRGISARVALEMATLGGARALGLAHRIGSLDVGKAADLAAFTLDGIGPTHDPEAAALFAVSGSRARFVAVGGKPLLENGRVVAGDDRELAARLERCGDALARWHSTTVAGGLRPE